MKLKINYAELKNLLKEIGASEDSNKLNYEIDEFVSKLKSMFTSGSCKLILKLISFNFLFGAVPTKTEIRITLDESILFRPGSSELNSPKELFIAKIE